MAQPIRGVQVPWRPVTDPLIRLVGCNDQPQTIAQARSLSDQPAARSWQKWQTCESDGLFVSRENTGQAADRAVQAPYLMLR